MGAPTHFPRCRKCELTWLDRYGLYWKKAIRKVGMDLELTGRARGEGKWCRAAEVRCRDCGHVWWSVHPQLRSKADKERETMLHEQRRDR